MSSFSDTSNWKRKNGTTLVYSYVHNGETHEGSSEMEPQTVDMQLGRLSVLNETSWRLKDKKEPDNEPGFFTSEYISALGILDNCRLHAITLDENPNQKSVQLVVTIYSAPLDKLQATSVADSWSPLAAGERPEDGWLKDEIGQIRYHSAGEYHEDSSFSAILLLSQHKFDELAQAIKQGTIRSARLSILADVYHFGYEGMGAGMRGHYYNYAILCKDEGTSALWGTAKGIGGSTRARIHNLILEWSPRLDLRMASRRDEPDEDNFLEPKLAPDERNIDVASTERDMAKAAARVAQDIQAIRGRVELFFQAAVFLVVLLVLGQVFDLLKG